MQMTKLSTKHTKLIKCKETQVSCIPVNGSCNKNWFDSLN